MPERSLSLHLPLVERRPPLAQSGALPTVIETACPLLSPVSVTCESPDAPYTRSLAQSVEPGFTPPLFCVQVQKLREVAFAYTLGRQRAALRSLLAARGQGYVSLAPAR